MSEAETRDAYHEVVVDLPNGKSLRGKPVHYADAMKLIAMRDEFALKGVSIAPYLARFHEITGTKADAPEIADLTLGEVIDATDRFFFWRRPGPTEVPAQNPSGQGSSPQ